MKISSYTFGFAVKRTGNYQASEVQNSMTVIFDEGEEPRTVADAQQKTVELRRNLFAETDKKACQTLDAILNS